MPWFKVDDGLHKSRKRIRLGRSIEGMAALGLWTHLGSWCADELTEGFVSDDDIEYLAPNIGQELAKRLEAVGMFERVTRYGVEGWYFHDWDDFQPSKEQVLADRAANAERQKRFRDKARAAREQAGQGVVQPVSNVASNGVTNASVTPVVTVPPTRPDPTRPIKEVQEQSEASLPPRDAKPKPAKRGTRIDPDFKVTPEMVTWAAKKCPHVDGRRETEKFVNHWLGEATQSALKLDWIAAWRKWMLIATERAPASRASPSNRVEVNGMQLKPKTAELLADRDRWAAEDARIAAEQAAAQHAIGGTAT